ncbi:MAG TPA: cytochrome b N-terminal domain-containing protein [Acidocella sp.]|uniref:cytochrome b N-terminal domain-containing protein n=1 Tax=Acidocella sp. TaxID=50710 RepID=UPI002BDF9DF8|nr:cytochrome b N-terminal domain-containing protein [Acidocella sp.]HVE21224.1 cytochrome b N-terminal domain-containing protein [Acidocella sp.]
MDVEAQKAWSDRGWPKLSVWRTRAETPSLAREQPYLDTLPALIAGTLLVLAASGLVLAVYYDPRHPYASIGFIRREVNYGWLIQSFHQSGTTMLFGAVYLLLFRGILLRLYKGSGEFVWLGSVALAVVLLLAGWLGYMLSGGAVANASLMQASLSAEIWPGLPGRLAGWFFGGPHGPGTLARLAVLHAVLGVAVFALLLLLRAARKAAQPQAANPVAFHPYYTAQYFVAFTIFALIFAVFVFFAPHFGDNPLNAVAPSRLIAPINPTPPWFLAPLSAVRVLLPGDSGGVIAVLAMLGLLFALPWLDRSPDPTRRTGFLYRLVVVVLALDVLALGLAAACRPSPLAVILQIVFALWYFFHFLVLTPLLTAMEEK